MTWAIIHKLKKILCIFHYDLCVFRCPANHALKTKEAPMTEFQDLVIKMPAKNCGCQNSATATIKPTASRPIPASSLESTDRRNYYLDLAGVESYGTSSSLWTTNRPPKNASIDVTDGSRPKPANPPNLFKLKPGLFNMPTFLEASAVGGIATTPIPKPCNTDAHGAARLGSGAEVPPFGTKELPKRADEKPATSVVSPRLRPKSSSAQVTNDLGANVSSSHYQRRHRHRERNHSRAMRQVAEWIEQEHASRRRPSSISTEKVIVVQRHEHHHFHEHFHHHYHYFSGVQADHDMPSPNHKTFETSAKASGVRNSEIWRKRLLRWLWRRRDRSGGYFFNSCGIQSCPRVYSTIVNLIRSIYCYRNRFVFCNLKAFLYF